MSCILRAAGRNFEVDKFLAATRLTPCAIFRKGESKPKSTRKTRQPGINIEVSQAGFEQLDRQVRDAVQFLQRNKDEVKKLVRLPGIACELDFGIKTLEVAVQSDHFPSQLLLLAGKLGLGITVSRYP